EPIESFESLPGASDINPPVFRRLLVKFAKAGHAGGIGFAAMASADRVVQWSLALRSPHHPVDLVRLAIIFCQPDDKLPELRMQRAKGAGSAATQVHFLEFRDSRDIVAERIFIPAVDLHTAAMRFGQDLGEDIEVTVVGSFGLLERGALIKLP